MERRRDGREHGACSENVTEFLSGTLPIALAAQSTVAGKYAVEATATGYQTQSVSKNISAADASQNFTLVP
jgi:hypothetical protein